MFKEEHEVVSIRLWGQNGALTDSAWHWHLLWRTALRRTNVAPNACFGVFELMRVSQI